MGSTGVYSRFTKSIIIYGHTKGSSMGLLDAGITDADYEGRPVAEAAPRKPIGIMGIALGVLLGNIFSGILAGLLYYLITH